MKDLYGHISETIRDLRLKSGRGQMSQEALAEHLKVAPNTVSRWETGTYKPTADDLDKLARYFRVSITVFFPDIPREDPKVAALTSAMAGLTESDMEEVIRYAEFRKARRALENVKRARPKK